jgi:hypothetical protein
LSHNRAIEAATRSLPYVNMAPETSGRTPAESRTANTSPPPQQEKKPKKAGRAEVKTETAVLLELMQQAALLDV